MSTRRALAALTPCLLAACGASAPGAETGGVHARFSLPSSSGVSSSSDFFALPFPNDLRRTPRGLDLTGFPNPKDSDTLTRYLAALAADTPGFGANAPLYATFDGPIDPASLPASPGATLLPSSAVQLVDLGPDPALSPAGPSSTGERTPLELRWLASSTPFLPANTLAARPVPGFPLRPGHRFALLLTSALRDLRGQPVLAAPLLLDALGPGRGPAASVTAPLVAWAAAASFPLETVALASVFTVQDATGAMARLRSRIRRDPAPAPESLLWSSSTRATHLFTGTFRVASYQQGSPPFLDSGGGFLVDATGAPVPQRLETVRFALTLPRGPAPAAGFPLLLYAHGTGGSYLSGSREGLADRFAGRGIATLTMDQVLHGPRNPGCTEGSPAYESCVSLSYFNFLNPYAGRDNGRQGAADLFQLALLARALRVPPSLHPESLLAGLDLARLAFLGHSQGGLTGAPFVAAEPDLAAAAFSGTGGLLTTTLLQRKDPIDFKLLAAGLVGLSRPEELDPFHPALALLQTFGEPADPINYARHLQREPLGGGVRDLLVVEGLLDPYTVADSSEAFAAAARLDLAGAVAHSSAGFLLRGLSAQPLPLSGNVPLPGAARTGALLQFPGQGHFAIFDDPIAGCRLLGLLSSSLAGSGSVPSCE